MCEFSDNANCETDLFFSLPYTSHHKNFVWKPGTQITELSKLGVGCLHENGHLLNMVVSEHSSGDISLCRYIKQNLQLPVSVWKIISIPVTIETRVKWITVVT